MRRQRDLTCSELVELVTEYLDGALASGGAERVEEHLTLCPSCVAHFEQMRVAIAITGRLRDDDLSERLAVDLPAAFRGRRPNTA